MSKSVDINDEYVTRVEGHGNIVVNIEDGDIEKCQWQVIEAPRFFESMVVDRSWKELHHVTSRICGICSMAHQFASLKATENAMDIEISDQDKLLRRLALHGETIQSHVLHVGYLALPDLLDAGSVIPLASSHPEEVKTVIRVHRTGNELSDTIGGRNTHQQRLIPGGFSKIPTENELVQLKEKLENSFEDLNSIAELIRDLSPKLANFSRETEFISLSSEDEYALYDGLMKSTDTGTEKVENYEEYTNEYIVPQSSAKYTKNNRESYMVGALARVNNNYDRLSPKAKEVAEKFDLDPVDHHPYMNNVAQLVETVHCFEDAIDIIDKLLDRGLQEQGDYHQPDIEVKAGRGVGAVEAPRGILIHDYTYDENGVCTSANCVIPTNQNHGNIQKDMEALVPEILKIPEGERELSMKTEIELALEMLVRAYDPCISCSTHYLDVEFVE
ncbi:hydrogenase/sulfur reductase subunit alpha [candidate division MSBL1 archaeon SCGC-AAA259D14]|uniref:Hydrogenase/sulfur reductase subunit alpha n=3 Tax=candidate division MSBL1 TaxID=215777 RepID=A0A133UUC5_9EURY|nr:hydrogenase/sulfur reductase subunit alpha [candidate division MSBL1 archaeon SCGC-AAA259D14]KXA97726.1 hydrogenase/sulfur reductase subunit alpha [candidate division MSBL1 archaeon SCGC-AAA259I14]KXA98959.1 hydrogenase/sulfur reductase subunit alpha [candidate division MSBL1 archaeon SCGC-AAA259J03]